MFAGSVRPDHPASDTSQKAEYYPRALLFQIPTPTWSPNPFWYLPIAPFPPCPMAHASCGAPSGFPGTLWHHTFPLPCPPSTSLIPSPAGFCAPTFPKLLSSRSPGPSWCQIKPLLALTFPHPQVALTQWTLCTLRYLLHLVSSAWFLSSLRLLLLSPFCCFTLISLTSEMLAFPGAHFLTHFSTYT